MECDKAMVGEVDEARVGLIDARAGCVLLEALQCLLDDFHTACSIIEASRL